MEGPKETESSLQLTLAVDLVPERIEEGGRGDYSKFWSEKSMSTSRGM